MNQFKNYISLSLLLILFLAGCEYEYPLSEDHNIPIDHAVLGLWEPVSSEEDVKISNEPMMILKYSDTEYLIQFPEGKKGKMFFRGYPIRIGNISCVQLEGIGTQQGPPSESIRKLFHVASYKIADDILEIRILNTDLVDDELETKEAIVQNFLKHQNHKELFIEPESFKRIKD